MNILKKIIYAVPVVAVMFAASCAKDSATVTEGDVADCYNVYFPEQDNTGDLEVAPEETLPKTYTYKARRTNADDEITVPVVLAENTDDVFVVSPIVFADGEKETTFTVTLTDKAELGVQYALKLIVEDAKYAPLYSGVSPTKHNPQFQIEVMRAHWVEVMTGTFSSELMDAKFAGVTVMQKENSNDYKIVNFIGTGADLVFTWDPDTNKCDIARQPSGVSIQGYNLDVMDFRNFYKDYFGEDYDWELLESAGYTQSYYNPDNKLFHLNLMYMDIATGFGTNPLDEKFIFKGGSFGCELSLLLLSPTRFVSTSKPIDSGTVSSFPESYAMGWQITAPSRNLKSIKFVIIPTESYDYPESELGMTLNDYVDNYGISGDTSLGSMTLLERLNSDDQSTGGWFASISWGLDPDTSYTLYAKAENDRGETGEFVAQYTTGEAGTYYKMSHLVEGEEEPFEVTFSLETNIITNSSTGEETPLYYVKNLGLENGLIWHAAYDEATSTLSIPGCVVGAEEDDYGNKVCAFGQALDALDDAQKYIYTVVSIDPTNEQSNGTDPCVFAIDEAGSVASLKTNLYVPVYYVGGTEPQLYGYLGYYPAGTAVAETTAPSDDSAETSSVKVHGMKVPFSSVTDFKVAKKPISIMAGNKTAMSVEKRPVRNADLKPLQNFKKLVIREKL